MLGAGTVVFEDLGVYLRSLGKLEDQLTDNARIYPGHGPVVEQGTAKVQEYVAHRQQRSDQIVAAISQLCGGGPPAAAGAAGPPASVTAREMTALIYSAYPEHLQQAAEGKRRLLDLSVFASWHPSLLSSRRFPS